MLRHRLLCACLFATAGCGGAASAPKVFPSMVYLGVEDTGMRYAAPIAVESASAMAYTVSDVSIARVVPGDQEVEIGALRAGATRITMRNDFGQATADVSITTYPSSARLAGQQAWNKFSCAGCHDSGPDVTSSGIGKHTDQQIEDAVVRGANPEGGDVSIGKSQHSFAIGASDPAFVGIVAFLRSLPARGVPMADQ